MLPEETAPLPPGRPTDPNYYAPRKSLYDVLFLRNGVSMFTAKPADYSRVTVEATDTGTARDDEAVAAKVAAGHYVVEVLQAGQTSQYQIDAGRREREEEEGEIDRVTLTYRRRGG